MIREHDMIALTEDLTEHGLKAGRTGTVVHIHPQGVAYEVEFFSPAGNTIAVATVEKAQARPAAPEEIEPLTVDYNWVQDGIAVLTLTNPKKRNVLSSRTLAALEEWLGWIAKDPEARVVVIRSEGPVFSSGHDLNELVNGEAEDYTAVFDACTRVMESIRLLPKPVIAQVQGLATAAGCQLVAACDLAVAADTARFATPGVRIGLFCSTPMVPVSRAVGRKRAMEMLLTGDFVDAKTALEWGLVNRVVPEDRLKDESQSFVERIAEASPFVVALGKHAFHRQAGLSVEDAYAQMSEVMCGNAVEPDAQEGMRAFLEKRPPRWTQTPGS